MVGMRDDWPVPQVGPGELLVQVHAVALAPGDVRMLSGATRLMQKPKSFPYIGGGDCAGVVVAVGSDQSDGHDKFSVGDEIYATFVDPNPLGCLAEYCVVRQTLASRKPHNITFLEASTLGSSGVTAQTLVEAADIKPGERVLVVGGTGGVGSFTVQLLKASGASFVAATSSLPSLALELGADLAIDYTKENWWEHPALTASPELRVDVLIDLVADKDMWREAKKCTAVKSAREGGRWIATMFDPYPRVHNYFHVIGLVGPMVGRLLWGSMNKSIPAYKLIQGLPHDSDAHPKFRRLTEKIEDGRARVVLDPAGPFPLTTEGLRAAYTLQKSRHAKGKVVVEVSST
eukprot:GFYU01007268.1.p1 GENE.GFYU01007268.1~~GFYU01007268.1.p1  ORF type:complete len:393 (+),score=65.75 GFYU01007268.1:143-1180(+)